MPTPISRRAFTLGAASLTLVPLFAGRAMAQGETRTVTTALGTYDIPAKPLRVACIDSRLDMQPALALGLNVVGYSHSEPGAWVPKPEAAVFYGAPPNLEQVLATNPDLIICADYDRDGEWWPISRLQTIAPVVPTLVDVPWKVALNDLAKVLGLTIEAEKVVAEYDALIADMKKRHADKLATRIVVSVQPSEGTVYLSNGSENLQSQVLKDLGGKTVENMADQKYGGQQVVQENFADMIGDVDGFLMATTGTEEMDRLSAEPTWQRLPAVAAGAVVVSNGNINYGSLYSALQVAKLFDELYGKIA